MGDPDVWPLLLDMSKDECKRILRRLELEAYSNLVSVLRAQGSLTPPKRRLLQNVAQTLSISEERHKAECRRAVNSEKLATIAKHMGGANSGTEWAIEGRRLVPLLPRLVPQTAFTAIADKVANLAMTEGAKLPLPTPPTRKRLTSSSIDETLLEPGVPEASKTFQVASGSPLAVSIPNSEHSVKPCVAGSPLVSENSPQLDVPGLVAPVVIPSRTVTGPPSPTDSTISSQSKQGGIAQQMQNVSHGSVPQNPHVSSADSTSVNHVQPPIQTVSSQLGQKSQVVLLMKKEEKSKDEQVSRKRPRSASLDLPLNFCPGTMLPPPAKKEAISPLSPVGSATSVNQSSSTVSPQSHSQLVQQQTLQAAAAAVAAAVRSSPTPSQNHHQLHHPHQPQQPPQPPPPPPPPPPTPPPTQQQQPTPPVSSQSSIQSQQPSQHFQLHNNLCGALGQSTTPSSTSGRTITIPSQGTVKLTRSSVTSNSGSGIPSGTHKVIIVSSTTPSILQRSLSVPMVKSLSTSAPSQTCSSTLVLNTAQQAASSTVTSLGNTDLLSCSSPQSVSSTLPSKLQGKIVSQSTPKTRSRANSIVIPVTPNQTSVMSSVGVSSVALKSGLQTGKQGISKPSDSGGLKIMPLTTLGSASKLVPKTAGSGPMYVVGTSSNASPTVSMVSRTVSSGPRVMTLASNVPKVAVSSSSSGNILSTKSVQTLQLSQAGGVVTSTGSLSSTPGKPNVIVVQKGSTAFSRGVTLSHGGKEVVGKVLLGGKALTTLNQSQVNNLTQIQAAPSSPLNPNSNLPSTQSQGTMSQSALSTTLTNTTSTPTRVVTVQKVPSAIVQGAAGSGNVIVLDLSQEQINNSAVLNEILASSILQSSNVMSFSHSATSDSASSPVTSLKGLINFSNEPNDSDAGVLLSDGSVMVEGLGDPIVTLPTSAVSVEEGNIASEYSASELEKPECSPSFVVDDSSLYGVQSSSGSVSATSNRTDICATAMSNANLNLNDFLDDNSLDDIQSMSLEGMQMDIASEAGCVSESAANPTAEEEVSTWNDTENTLVPDSTEF